MTHPANETRLAAAAMPLGLFVYTLLYGGMTVLAGVLAFKQVQLWPTELAVESGIFAFLLLVVISSTIAQLYGEKLANRIVWWGFVPLLVASLLMQLVLNLPPSVEMTEFRADDLAAFERVHATLWRVWMAGPAAYIVSLLLNVWIFSRLRGSAEGASTLSLMARGAIASALSQAIDSVIFITLAFYGQFEITNLLIGQVVAKVALSLVLVPFLITGGVAFQESPLEGKRSLDVNYLDADRTLIGLGATLELRDPPVLAYPLSLSFGYQYQMIDERDFELTSTDPMVPVNPYETVTTEGDVSVFSGSMTMKF